MRTFKKIVISAVLVTASFTAFAEATGEAKVRAAAEGTIVKIQEAIALVEKGGKSEEVTKSISEARQLQKEFRFEGTERVRQKANEKLKKAREAFDEGDKVAADAALKEALSDFTKMKATYDETHK